MTAVTSSDAAIAQIRQRVQDLLAQRGDRQTVRDDESLFFSGRLDSLAATELMLMLEGTFGLDLADAAFDITQLDTIADMGRLLDDMQAA